MEYLCVFKAFQIPGSVPYYFTVFTIRNTKRL